jgi:hypothetical protein
MKLKSNHIKGLAKMTDTRDSFEKWYAKHWHKNELSEKVGDDYVFPLVQKKWECWQAALQSGAGEGLRSAAQKVMLENSRLRDALEFYSRHEHWMSTSENHEPQMLLIAHRGDSVYVHGWDVAQRTLAVNHARLLKFVMEELAIDNAQATETR